MKKIKQKLGFTLFELLVSISIIAILTALASVSFSSAQKKARDSRRTEDMKNIQTAAEQYYSMNSYVYPASYTAGTKWTTANGTVVLESFPSDPKTGGLFQYYVNSSSTAGYCICAQMEMGGGNSTVSDCTAFATSGGYFCVKNQQ